MVAENNLVAVRFIRTGEIEGESFSAEVMQFMRFENEKIVEVWEVYDASQFE
jgi:predicted SnoaL-like aldol condensation-catalyzing enzyme